MKQKMMQEDLKVIVVRNGVAKELRNLSSEVKLALIEAYDKEPVKGISKEEYLMVAELMTKQIGCYQQKLSKDSSNEKFPSAITFAEAFGITPLDSHLLVDILTVIDFFKSECPEAFNGNMLDEANVVKYLNAYNRQEYRFEEINGDFLQWAKEKLVGGVFSIIKDITKFCKFYYILSNAELSTVLA